MPEQEEIAQYQIYRTVRALDDARPVLKTFMSSLNGVNSTGRESLMAFTILERIYYNVISASPLAKELMFNQNIAVPLSQIFRSVVYEIVVGYWLLESDFTAKMAKLNNDFIKKAYNKLKADSLIADLAALEKLFAGWEATAPENFAKDANNNLIINTAIKSITFSAICDELSNCGHDLKSLTAAYTVLSQQAHLSEFSRRMIYEKHLNNASLFDFITWYLLRACIMLIKKIDASSSAIAGLEMLLVNFPDHEQKHLSSQK